MTDCDTQRSNSKLECDDPMYCRECGAKIQLNNEYTDSEGRPMTWLAGDWVSVELCIDCWAKEELGKLQHLCMDRYNGSLSELLVDE